MVDEPEALPAADEDFPEVPGEEAVASEPAIEAKEPELPVAEEAWEPELAVEAEEPELPSVAEDAAQPELPAEPGPTAEVAEPELSLAAEAAEQAPEPEPAAHAGLPEAPAEEAAEPQSAVEAEEPEAPVADEDVPEALAEETAAPEPVVEVQEPEAPPVAEEAAQPELAPEPEPTAEVAEPEPLPAAEEAEQPPEPEPAVHTGLPEAPAEEAVEPQPAVEVEEPEAPVADEDVPEVPAEEAAASEPAIEAKEPELPVAEEALEPELAVEAEEPEQPPVADEAPEHEPAAETAPPPEAEAPAEEPPEAAPAPESAAPQPPPTPIPAAASKPFLIFRAPRPARPPAPEPEPKPAPRRARARSHPTWHRAIRLALRAVMALTLLAGMGAAALAWRLSRGPLELPWLQQRLEAGITLPGGGQVTAAHAFLAWEGWSRGAGALPSLRLDAVRFAMPGVTASVERALVQLSLPALLRGEIAPSTIELQAPVARIDPTAMPPGDSTDTVPADPLAPWMAAPDEGARHLALRRLELRDGRVELAESPDHPPLALSGLALSVRRPPQGALEAEGQASLELLGETIPLTLNAAGAEGQAPHHIVLQAQALHPAIISGLAPPLAPLAELEASLNLSAGVEVDRALVPRVLALHLTSGPGIWRPRAGGQLAFQQIDLRLGLSAEEVELREARAVLGEAGAAQLPLFAQGHARREGDHWTATATAEVAVLDLSRLGGLWPASMAPETRQRVLDNVGGGVVQGAQASGSFTVSMSEGAPAIALTAARLRLPVRAPLLGAGTGVLGQEALLDIFAEQDHLRLAEAWIRLAPPRPEAQPTTLNASGQAMRADDGWRAELTLGLDGVAFQDLPRLWPQGLGGGTRGWITENLTNGVISGGVWRFGLTLPDAGEPQLTRLEGQARVVGATVHWLRPVPPIQGVSGNAEFTLDAVTLTTEGGRQTRADGTLTGVEVPSATLRFTGLRDEDQFADMAFQIQGSLPDLVSVLRHPRLKLFERRPLDLTVAAGQQNTRFTLAFPLLKDIPNEALRVRAESRITGLAIPRILLGQALDNGTADLVVDPERLRVNGTANLLGAPMRLSVDMDLRNGAPAQIVTRETMQGTLSAEQLRTLGFDLGDILTGSVALNARTERRRNGQGQVFMQADLAPARLDIPVAGWRKDVGSPGSAEAVLRLEGDRLVSVENGRVDVLELSLRGRAVANRNSRIERYEVSESQFGGSRFQGEVRPPAQPGAPWVANLRGPIFDLRPILGRSRGEPPAEGAEPPTVPPLTLEARFDRVTTTNSQQVLGLQLRAAMDDHSVLRSANVRGRTAASGENFELAVAPRGQGRTLRLTAENGGALLRAFDATEAIEGGRLSVTGAWENNTAGTPLVGMAEMETFTLRRAPAMGKVLQAMTLYGLVDALQGGSGLNFARMTVPFSLTEDVFAVMDARAISSSLGVTARGRVLRGVDVLDIEGTIVPAYLFNQMLGNLPVLGRLFSPEPGGGVFATSFRAQGPAADPQVLVNPLSTLTPGFLRGLFGLGQEPASTSSQAPARR